ncbi:MAG: hypothetical protein WBH31_09105 [Promethearchaeia archaeon]
MLNKLSHSKSKNPSRLSPCGLKINIKVTTHTCVKMLWKNLGYYAGFDALH